MDLECNFVGPDAPQSSIGQRRAALEVLASEQHGVVARRQLLALGFSADEIRGMLASRRLVAIHRGVYAVGHRAPNVRGVRMAAALACGPRALIGYRSAGALRGFRRSALSYVEVATPTRRRGIDGVRPYSFRSSSRRIGTSSTASRVPPSR